VDAPLPEPAVLAIIALLFASVAQAMLISRRLRALESQLADARGTIRLLRRHLDDANRPPAQFARMRLRDVAVERFARLRLALPPRSQPPDVLKGPHLRVH
jgi:hypothetical protein